MAGFPASLWVDSSPGAWVMLALALYGLVAFLLDLTRLLRRLVAARRQIALSILVLVHNQEGQIEGLVRTLAARGSSQWAAGGRWELILVDFESNDATPLILERLAREFTQLRLVTLPADRSATACETALFLCRSPVTLLVDLRHQVDAVRWIHPLEQIWQ